MLQRLRGLFQATQTRRFGRAVLQNSKHAAHGSKLSMSKNQAKIRVTIGSAKIAGDDGEATWASQYRVEE
jgi:hypothetical protein